MKKLVSIFLVALLILSFSIAYADQQAGNESASSGQQTENSSPPTNPKWDPSQVNIIETNPSEVIGGPADGPDTIEGEVIDLTKPDKYIRVFVDDILIDFPDTKPYIKDNRTLVPVRFVSEQLGAKVDWDEKNQQVTIEKDGKKILLKIDSKDIFVNDSKITLDVPAELKDGRTMVPLRFISEAFGAEVEWEDTSKSVFIMTGNH